MQHSIYSVMLTLVLLHSLDVVSCQEHTGRGRWHPGVDEVWDEWPRVDRQQRQQLENRWDCVAT